MICSRCGMLGGKGEQRVIYRGNRWIHNHPDRCLVALDAHVKFLILWYVTLWNATGNVK